MPMALTAAAHASCFAMALALTQRQKAHPPTI
jgi:organic hydroperoxide reductase OsmC/OhrA